jgi:antitoxin CptB
MKKQDRGSRIEDRGSRIQNSSTGDKELHRVSHPRSAILDPVSMQRIRWRCRRGLLELDIVLGRFIEHYASLNTQQQVLFDTLLDLPDTNLWDMISGKLPALDEDQRELLLLINTVDLN